MGRNSLSVSSLRAELRLGPVFTEFAVAVDARENREGEEWIAPLANALFNFHIIFLVGCLFVGIAFQSYALNMTAIAMGLETYLARRRQEASRKTVRQVLQRSPAVEKAPLERPA